MLNKVRTLALSVLIGLGALAAIPATAQADGVYLNFGGQADSRFGVYAGDREDGVRDWHRHRDHDWRRDRDWRRGRDWRRSCTPGRALDKAADMGLRRARIVDVNRHTVKVSGRKFNNRVTVVFGNERGCPIVYR